MSTWQFVEGVVFLLLVGALHALLIRIWIRWVLHKV